MSAFALGLAQQHWPQRAEAGTQVLQYAAWAVGGPAKAGGEAGVQRIGRGRGFVDRAVGIVGLVHGGLPWDSPHDQDQTRARFRARILGEFANFSGILGKRVAQQLHHRTQALEKRALP
jgi:hypothetical protein